MNTPPKSPRRVLRLAVATFALTAAAAATAGTSAHAYPPVPLPPPAGEVGSAVVVAEPVAFAPAQGDLPATGGSGVSTALAAGGLALLVGVGLTSWSVVSDRRRSAADHSVG